MDCSSDTRDGWADKRGRNPSADKCDPPDAKKRLDQKARTRDDKLLGPVGATTPRRSSLVAKLVTSQRGVFSTRVITSRTRPLDSILIRPARIPTAIVPSRYSPATSRFWPSHWPRLTSRRTHPGPRSRGRLSGDTASCEQSRRIRADIRGGHHLGNARRAASRHLYVWA